MALPLLVERLAAALRSDQRRLAAEKGLSPVHVDVLRYLARCNRYSDTPAAVAEYLGSTPGTVSQTLSLLVRRGLVEKVPDHQDARRVHCVLTPEGRRVVHDVASSDTVRGAIASLGARAQLVEEGLRELLLALQVHRQGRSFGECRTCRLFQRTPDGFRCGLTGERLTKEDTDRLCREHAPPKLP